MKLIIFIAACLILFSCDDSVKSAKVSEQSYVEVQFLDSSKWEPAKIYIPQPNKLYFKTKQGDVYQVWGNAPVEFIGAMLLGLFIGVMIGVKLNEA